MNNTLSLLIVSQAFLLGLVDSQAAVNYIADDGSLDLSVGVGGSGGDLMVLNRLEAQAGGESITNIQINWTGVADGTAATLAIYDDPNNDGNPNDLVLLAQIPVLTAGGGGFNNSFTDYFIPSTTIGGHFYVGALLTDTSGADYPIGYDTTNPDFSGVSLFFERTGPGDLLVSDPILTSTLSGFVENFITPGNFMIRASSDLPVVPEPSVMLLLVGLVGVPYFRSRLRNRTS